MTEHSSQGGGRLDEDSLVTGTLIAQYQIVQKVGAGGMGVIYVADDTKLKRRVALKFLSSDIARDEMLRARFNREVQAVAALNHPNIVHVYEVSEWEGRPFFAMEYVQGGSLRGVIEERRTSWAGRLGYACGICEGLQAAHDVGIVHRDIKPANIVIDQNHNVKILDFGLAKRPSDTDLTTVGSTLGTIAYMSPEQVQGMESDRRSDLFSLGIVLYELFTGVRPFQGNYDAETLMCIVNTHPKPITDHVPDAPPDLQPILDGLLEKDINARYQSITDFLPTLTALRDRLRYSTSAARSPAEGTGRPRRTGLVIGAAVTVVVLGGTLFWQFGMKSGPVDERASVEVNRPTALPATGHTRPQTIPSGSGGVAPVTDSLSGFQPDTGMATALSADAAADTQAVTAPAPGRSEPTVAAPSGDTAKTVIASAQDNQDNTDTRTRDTRNASSVAGNPDKSHLAQEPSQPAAQPPPETQAVVAQEVRIPPVENVAAPTRAAPVTEGSTETAAPEVVAQVESVLATYWDALEERDFKALKRVYPQMPGDWENTWRTFIDNARGINVASVTRAVTMSGDHAEADVAVSVKYKDSKGRHRIDLRYTVRLSPSDGAWLISNITQKQ